MRQTNSLVYGSDALYERALAVGQVLETAQTLALLPTTRPAPDNLRAQQVYNRTGAESDTYVEYDLTL